MTTKRSLILAALIVAVASIWIYRPSMEARHQAAALAEFEAEQERSKPLEKIVTLQFGGLVTVEDWLAEFTRQSGFPIDNEQTEFLPRAYVGTYGYLEPHTPILLDLPPMSVRDALDTFCQVQETHWRLNSNGVITFHADELEVPRELRIHPLPAELRAEPVHELMRTLTAAWQADRWSDVGGPWHWQATPDSISTLMTPADHDRFATLLRHLAVACRDASTISQSLSANELALEPVWLQGQPATIDALLRAFNQPISLRENDLPWQFLVKKLTEQARFPIVVSPYAATQLEHVAQHLSLEVDQVPLQRSLAELDTVRKLHFVPTAGGRALLLRQEQLAYDEVQFQQLFAYPIGDLVGKANEGDLLELITSVVTPDSWQDVGGPGSAHLLNRGRLLLIGQTLELHAQVRELLTALRTVRSGAEREFDCESNTPTRRMSTAVAARLETPIACEYRGEKRPQALTDVLQRGGVQIPGLDEQLKRDQLRFWCYLPKRPLRDNLESLLGACDFDVAYLEQALPREVSPPAIVDRHEQLNCYVFDLRPWLTEQRKMPEVTGLITSVIDPDTWQDAGGPNSLQTYDDLLFCRCPPHVANRVREFLAALVEHCAPRAAPKTPRLWRGQPLAGDALNRPLNMIFGPPDFWQRSIAANKQIRQQLQQRVTLSIASKSLGAAVFELAREHNLPLIASTRWTDFEAREIDFHATDMPLGELLQQLVGEGNAWRLEYGCLVLRHTHGHYQPADVAVQTYAYSVDDLIAPHGPFLRKQIIRTLLSTIADNDLDDEIDVSYQGMSVEFGNLLTASFYIDNESGRALFEQLLRALRSGQLRPLPEIEEDRESAALSPYGNFRPFLADPLPLNAPAVGGQT